MPDTQVPEIVLAAAGWKTPDDFYAAFLGAVGAPPWHGRNLDALWDSISAGDINRINPPYRIRITGISDMAEECKHLLDRFTALIRQAKDEGSSIEIALES